MLAPDRPPPDAHPARLILTLSLAATVGLGIGRFAYALVLPDMRENLGWSYSAAGFMNTINAVGYLVGALVASRLIQRVGWSAAIRGGTAGLRRRAGGLRLDREFCRAEPGAAGARHRRRGRLRGRRRARRDRRAVAPGAGQFPAEPVLCRPRHRHSLLRADRAVHAAAFRPGLVVDRVVGADAALGRHDRAAVPGPDRERRAFFGRQPRLFRDSSRADLSRRLLPVWRRLHRLHDLHDRLCARRRRRRRGAGRDSGA